MFRANGETWLFVILLANKANVIYFITASNKRGPFDLRPPIVNADISKGNILIVRQLCPVFLLEISTLALYIYCWKS